MAYKRTNWTNNQTPLNADNLNNIENGIVNEISNREAADAALQESINAKQNKLVAGTNITIDGDIISVTGGSASNLVDLTSVQSISGIKTFTNEVKTNQIANVNDNAMVRFKEIEGKNVFGGITYDCVLMGKSSRPFYSKNGSDFTGNELALISDIYSPSTTDEVIEMLSEVFD